MTRSIVALLVFTVVFASPAADPPKPKFKLGKDTTFVDGPLDKDGYIDYETALNDRLRGKIKPDDNAVVLLVQVCGPKPDGKELPPNFYHWLNTTPPAEDGAYLISSSTFFKQDYREDFEKHFALESKLRQSPWKAKDHPKFAAWLNTNVAPLAKAVEASNRTEFYLPFASRPKDGDRRTLLGGLFSPITQTIREVANLLTFRSMLRVGEGQLDEAWQDLLAIHRLGRLASRGGTMTGFLVGVALDSIACSAEVQFVEVTKPTADQIAKYRADLAKLPPLASFADTLDLGERLFVLDMVQSLQEKGMHLLAVSMRMEAAFGKAGGLDPIPEELLGLMTPFIEWQLILRRCNRLFDRLVAVHRIKDRAERVKAITELTDEMKRLRSKDRWTANLLVNLATGRLTSLPGTATAIVGDLLIGSMPMVADKIGVAVDRAEQQNRNLHLAFALAAYHADHKKYPAALADLAPKYIEQIPTDLFSGKPLVYKPSDTGYLLYSVGVNGTDDGGKTFGDDPPGDDLRVRMPSVKPK